MVGNGIKCTVVSITIGFEIRRSKVVHNIVGGTVSQIGIGIASSPIHFVISSEVTAKDIGYGAGGGTACTVEEGTSLTACPVTASQIVGNVNGGSTVAVRVTDGGTAGEEVFNFVGTS